MIFRTNENCAVGSTDDSRSDNYQIQPIQFFATMPEFQPSAFAAVDAYFGEANESDTVPDQHEDTVVQNRSRQGLGATVVTKPKTTTLQPTDRILRIGSKRKQQQDLDDDDDNESEVDEDEDEVNRFSVPEAQMAKKKKKLGKKERASAQDSQTPPSKETELSNKTNNEHTTINDSTDNNNKSDTTKPRRKRRPKKRSRQKNIRKDGRSTKPVHIQPGGNAYRCMTQETKQKLSLPKP